MAPTSYRTCAAAVGVALLVALAGCPGPLQPGGGSGPATATEATATEETATEDETTTGNASESEAAATGQLLFAVHGRDTHLDPAATNRSDGVWINESDHHTWHAANESTTLAAALDAFGVDASANSLTYAGETYWESPNGTTIDYRVDGETVDAPANYRLEDGDEVHVTVYGGNLTTPGREYSSSHPHPHGTLQATIDGRQVNFSRERYVMNDEHFHFHGDENATRWHAHSINLTASYALSTFDGFDVTNGSVTYNGTTYGANRTTVTVNGDRVDPGNYVLKDGDDVSVVVNETG